jgi:hypothetical protein
LVPARTHVGHVGVRDAAARDQLPQHEGEAGGHGVDRERLALEVGPRLDSRCRDDGQESTVAAHHHDELRLARELRFTLPFLVSDEIVDRRHRDVVAAIIEAFDERGGVRRVRELNRDAVRFEESLAVRGPHADVPPAIERHDANRRQGSLLRRRVTEPHDERHHLHDRAKHAASSSIYGRTGVGQTSTGETA